MKDNEFVVQHFRDRGEEPNIDDGPMWTSADIWIRHAEDGQSNHDHLNPEWQFNNPSQTNHVYVQIRNRGCVTSSGGTVKLYWSKAGTALSYPSYWDGSQVVQGQALGEQIGTINLPPIPAGESFIGSLPWMPVAPSNFASLSDASGNPLFTEDFDHYCLLARVESTQDPITSTNGTALYEYVQANNNVVWKNITVVNSPLLIATGAGEIEDVLMGGEIFVGNAWNTQQIFDLEFTNPRYYNGNPITAETEVNITLDGNLWQKWEEGGYQSENIVISREDNNKVTITGNPARLKNLTYSANERSLMHVGFNFLAKQLSGQTNFRYHIVQRVQPIDNIVGGETYHITIPGREGFYADAGGNKEISPGDNVNLSAYDIGETAAYNWYDHVGNLIFTGKDINISPEITKQYKLEVIATVDGTKDYDNFEIKVKEFEITSISPNPATNYVNLEYNANNATSAYLIISMPYGISNNYILNTDNNTQNIDVSSYQKGHYNVILVCNGQAVDVSSLIIQ